MAVDWRGVLRNRWTWVAAAGVGGVAGLVVFLRRRGSSSGGSSGGFSTAPAVAGETSGYASGGLGYSDTTATDIAQQLGQREAIWEGLFRDFTTDVEERLAQMPTEGPVVYVPAPPSSPAPSSSTGGKVLTKTEAKPTKTGSLSKLSKTL